MIVLSQEEAIARFRAAHGDRYDYSRTNYISMAEELIVICPEHGPFWIKAMSHVQGAGCPDCPDTKKMLNKARFIQEGIAMHGDVHDYSKVSSGLRGRNGNVTLICKIHKRKFDIGIKAHLDGRIGCELCAAGDEAMVRQTFMKVSRNNYGKESFDYGLVPLMIRDKEQVIRLTCLKHDHLFTQPAGEHIDTRSGCEQCGFPEKQPADLKIAERLEKKGQGTKRAKEKREKQIEAAISMHGDIHDYSEAPDSMLMTTVIPLTCQIHGKRFETTLRSHLEGEIGCPECALGDDVMTRQVFKHLSQESYGEDAFDYSGLPKMIRSAKQVIHLTCIPHDYAFSQTAGEHLGKHSGCEPCGFPKRKPLTEEMRKKRKLARAARLKKRDQKLEQMQLFDEAIEHSDVDEEKASASES